MNRRPASNWIRTPRGRTGRSHPVRFFPLHPPAQTLVTIQPSPQPAAAEDARETLQPIPSGQFYRVTSPAEESLVTLALASDLNRVLDQFAQSNGFSAEQPLSITFKRGMLGLHHFGRAADIHAAGGKGIGQWANEWNMAMRRANSATDPKERARLVEAEKQRNLGYKLYKALQAHGGWAQPPKYPVQLFGPWTRGEGPHNTISNRLLHAHRDHIHVAK